MHARIITIGMDPGLRGDGVVVAERWFAGVAALAGSPGVSFSGDEETGPHGAFSPGDTREQGGTTGRNGPGIVARAFARLALGRPRVEMLRVHEPRAAR